MITEDYVSFETAKLLKEKGFDECTISSYDKNGGLKDMLRPFLESEGDVRRPTLQMAMKWLREVHHLLITPFSSSQESWMFRITKPRQRLEDGVYGEDYETREQACEAAIKYCLKI